MNNHPAQTIQSLSPRVKMAAKLYVTGACKTKKEASIAAGLAPNYLTLLRDNPLVNEYINRIEDRIEDGSVDMSKVLVTLGRKAVVGMARMMESETVKDDIRFKAMQDLADRSPETSKTIKQQMTSDLSMTVESAALLAAALVESARNKENYIQAAQGDYITVDIEKEVKLLPSGPVGG